MVLDLAQELLGLGLFRKESLLASTSASSLAAPMHSRHAAKNVLGVNVMFRKPMDPSKSKLKEHMAESQK